MSMLSVENLHLELPTQNGTTPILRGVSLSVAVGETLGLVGESGSGKSMTARSIMRLLPKGATTSGSITFEGQDVLSLPAAQLRKLRSDGIAMIFQDPKAHINPVRSIGDFLCETQLLAGTSKQDARKRAVEALEAVRISNAAARLRSYPHELSGGMLQRVMIASAILSKPRLLLADEPTTALDVTTQAEVMGILSELQKSHGVAMIMITHDLELAAAVCQRTAVMFEGTIVEEQASRLIHEQAQHPYTRRLVGSRPGAIRHEPAPDASEQRTP